MDSAWPLLLFLAGLTGCALLILICGIQCREQERAEAADAARSEAPAPARSFFATLEEAFAPAMAVDDAVDDATVQNVERRLRLLTAQANRFVESPSIDNFHDFGEGKRQVEQASLFCRFQKFLQQERVLAGEFVSDPSLDRFQGQQDQLAI